MSAEQPVIRTYRARERSEAEEAYRLDAETAEQQHWYPVAHRWSSSWAGEELSVVFEHRPDGGDGVTPQDDAPAAKPGAVAAGPVELVAEPDGGVEAADGSEQDQPDTQPEETLFELEPSAEPNENEMANPAETIAEPDTEETATSAEPSEGPEAPESAEPSEEPEAPGTMVQPESETDVHAETPTPEDEVWAPEPAVEAEMPEMAVVEADAGEPTEAAAAEAEHEAQIEAEHEAQAGKEDAEAESSGESLSAADDESPWTEYDASPAEAPEDALAREEPWVASALVDEHEPGYMSVAATAVAVQMHDDWTTLPIESDEPEAEVTAQPEATSEPEAEVTAEPEATADAEVVPALSTEDHAAWIAAAQVAQAAPGSSVASTERSEPMPASMPAVRAHARALVQAIDLHTAGEPLRLIRSGFPSVPSAPILERRAWLKDHLDFARQVLMWEPRGHRDMYGAILLPPYAADADVSVLFMHNEGYSTMCGHGIIAITTALIEEGLYPATTPETEIRFETPAGIVTATAPVARTDDGRHEVSSVRFQNVPSYLHERDIQVRPDGIQLAGVAADHGSVLVDIAFGGAYYGIVNAADLGLRVVPEQADALTRAGAAITDVLRRDHTPTHPTEPDLGFVYGTIIVDDDPASAPDGRARNADLRNVTIFADAEVDRSPCGSGTSALLARLHALGQLDAGTKITNAGITGEAFRAWVDSDTQIGDRAGVLTSVEGNAYVTGYHTFVIDDRDPLGNGFLLS